MANKKFSRKMILFLVIFFAVAGIFLYYPHRVNYSEDTIQSIGLKLTKEDKTYYITVTDKVTIKSIVDTLNQVTYKKASYEFDTDSLGMGSYEIQIINNNGQTDIIQVYHDNTIRIQSNGRYSLEKGVGEQLGLELFDLCKEQIS